MSCYLRLRTLICLYTLSGFFPTVSIIMLCTILKRQMPHGDDARLSITIGTSDSRPQPKYVQHDSKNLPSFRISSSLKLTGMGERDSEKSFTSWKRALVKQFFAVCCKFAKFPLSLFTFNRVVAYLLCN